MNDFSQGREEIGKNRLIVSLRLIIEANKIRSFFPLLQQGFMVKVQVGCSIKATLCEQFGLSPEYVEDRIKTIFMDGKAVDDIDSAVVKDRSTLALSAAMPGLVGATLRRGSSLASLRSQISHREGEKVSSLREGIVVLKLFNLLMSELGPTFLRKGIFVRREQLEGLFMNLPEDFWEGCKAAHVDGQEVGLDRLLKHLGKYDVVMLRVDCDA